MSAFCLETGNVSTSVGKWISPSVSVQPAGRQTSELSTHLPSCRTANDPTISQSKEIENLTTALLEGCQSRLHLLRPELFFFGGGVLPQGVCSCWARDQIGAAVQLFRSFNPLCWATNQTCILALQRCYHSHCATAGILFFFFLFRAKPAA